MRGLASRLLHYGVEDLVRMLQDQPLTISALLKTFRRPISLTWFLMLCETGLTAFIPLLIGFAIDGLLAGDTNALLQLTVVLAALIAVSVIRRLYDTRVYGTIGVELGKALTERSADMPVSKVNARLEMSRELVEFLEKQAPAVMASAIQLIVALVVLFAFHPFLFAATCAATLLMIVFYALSHRRFFRLYADYNRQTEQQVRILESAKPQGILSHLNKIRRVGIRLSDTEAYIYGAIYTEMLGLIVFNLWFAATNMEVTVGRVFSIISYSWEFVEAALVLPVTLQSWSHLSEIMQRINKTSDTA